MLELQLLPNVSYLDGRPITRTCGECQACCEKLAVVALGKPYDCQCRSQTSAGCGVYEQRPLECQAYACLWLLGIGREEDSPDQSGLLWDLSPDGQGNFFIDIHELRPGGVLALSEQQFYALSTAAHALLPPDVEKHFGGVRVWPHGKAIGNSHPARDGYPACLVAHTVFAEAHRGNGVFVYLGPCGADGRLLIDGRPASEQEMQDAFRETIRQLEGP